VFSQTNFDNALKFICSGEKCRGINFSIRYPNTWKMIESDYPHCAVKIWSDMGEGLEGLIIQIFEGDGIERLNLHDAAFSLLNKNTNLIAYKDNLLIDQCNAVSVTYTTISKKIDIPFELKGVSYLIKYKGKLIIFSFETTWVINQKDKLNKRFNDNMTVFTNILKSFVLLSKWDK
jgi:hypothetical protein